MSPLWTPGGESLDPRDSPGAATSPPPAGAAPRAGAEAGPDEAAARAELDRLQAELRATPVGDIVANHAIGLWQLAVLHLGLEDRTTMNLGEAGLAIDAVGALVDGLGPRLGRHESPLRDALTQLRMAFVQQTST